MKKIEHTKTHVIFKFTTNEIKMITEILFNFEKELLEESYPIWSSALRVKTRLENLYYKKEG